MATRFSLKKFQENRDEARQGLHSWSVSAKDLVAAYKAGERDFKRAFIEAENLNYLDFSGANFEKAFFVATIATGSVWTDANLNYSSIIRSNFQEANFDNAQMLGLNAELSNLAYASFSGTTSVRSTFRTCFMVSVHVTSADFHGSIFKCCQFTYSTIKDSIFSQCHFESTGLDQTSIVDSSLYNAFMYHCLSEVKLENVNVIDMLGLYVYFSPNMSSRHDSLYAGITNDNGKLKLRFWAGCQSNKTGSELKALVNNSYSDDDIHNAQYLEAIKSIRAMFINDMSHGKWDYLLTLE